MSNSRKKMFLLSAGVSLLLTGCSNAQNNTDTVAANAAAPETRTVLISSVSGKPGAPVTLSHTMVKTIEAGDVVTIDLDLDSSADQGTLSIKLTADDGITLIGTDTAEYDLRSEQSFNINTSVTTGTTGLHYVNVFATYTSPDGRVSVRTFAVPVQVGGETNQKPAFSAVETDANGTRVIVMPAVETP